MISVDNIHVSIGGSHILHGVSLAVRTGQLVAVIGANGAGKTTLLRTLSGLLPLDSGEVRFDGQRIDGRVPHKLAQAGLVHVPQGRQVIPQLTVEENLLIGAQQLGTVSRAENARAIEKEYQRFPVLFERRRLIAGSLSGGEQQMLAVSRALMMRPKLLMLDEPSLGLAPRIVELIINTLRELADKGAAVLLVEQAALSALKVADHALVLRGGKVVLEGPGPQLRGNSQLLHSFLG